MGKELDTIDEQAVELELLEQSVVIGPAMTETQLGQVRDVLSGAVAYELPEADSSQISEDILNRLLFAEDEQALTAEVPTWSSKDHVGRVFRILPAGRLWPSKIVNKTTGRKGAFASIQAIDPQTGEMGVLNTSSPYIVGKLAWYAAHGMLPADFEITVRGTSSNGYDILDVEKLAA